MKVDLCIICLITIAFLLCSCSSFENEKIENIDEEVTLLNENSNDFKNSRMLLIYENGQYEMYVPIYLLIDYVSMRNDENFKQLINYSDNILKEKKGSFIKNSLFRIYPKYGEIEIYPKSLFRRGKYFIFDKTNQKYIEKIRFKSKSWYAGTMAASFDTWIYIDDFIFWEFHATA